MNIEIIWELICQHEGKTFYLLKGKEFTYTVKGNCIKLSATNYTIAKSSFEKALAFMPLENTVPLQQLPAPSYLFAILTDKRICANEYCEKDIIKNKIMKEIKQFFLLLSQEQIEVYNEFSLQHELGIYLRKVFSQYKIQFERNTKFFGISDCIKHEIDIVIYNEKEKYAIELKYPLNGQYPEQMYSFIKDIKFCEELKTNGFNATFCVTLVQDKNFYEGKRIDGIYSYFRGNNVINGRIEKPTGAIKESVEIHNSYHVNWECCNDERFYIVECIN